MNHTRLGSQRANIMLNVPSRALLLPRRPLGTLQNPLRAGFGYSQGEREALCLSYQQGAGQHLLYGGMDSGLLTCVARTLQQ